MNITINPQDNPFLVKNNNKFKSTLQSGSIITGVITSKDTQNAIVKFDNNAKMKLDPDQVEGKTGDKVSFEVLDSGNNKLVLKQIKAVKFSDTLTAQESIKNANIQELYEKAGYTNEKDNSNNNDEPSQNTEQQKLDFAITLLRSRVKFGNAKNSKSAIGALVSSGIDLSKVSLNTMSKIVSGATNNGTKAPDKTPEELENLKTNFENKGFTPEQVSEKMDIASKLNESGLAVNESNIEQIDKFLNDIKELQTSKIDTINILKNEKPLTVKNLLSSKHSNTPSNPAPEGLDEEIKSLLSSIDIEATEENVIIAKDLIANEVDITNENFVKIDFMQNKLQSLNIDTLISNAIEQIRSGTQLADIDLQNLVTTSKPVDYTSLMNGLSNVGDNTINFVNNNDLPVTIENLVNNIQPENTTQEVPSNFATRKQIIEIQLRMTSSVMFTLNKNNIDISTQPLLDALNSIKEAENTVYDGVLGQMNAVVNTDNKNLITKTVDAVMDSKSTINAVANSSLQGLFNKISSVTNFLPEMFNTENPINLETINTNISKMAQAYDESISDPNAKFADNFSKVSEQIAPLLESLGIEPTDAKIKAGSVLVRNNLEVNAENIKKVETINLKVERLLDKLTPHIASKMLAEGLNPLTENVDTMLNYIDAFNDINGTNAGDNLAKQLIKLEKDKNVDEETLNGIKAIYRALNTINANGLSSVGAYLDTKRELTLNSLLDSAKVYSQNRGKYNVLNKAIDDTTSISETFTIGKSIKELINSNVATERTYEHEQVLRFMENADYEGLKELIQENPDVYDEILQNVTDKLVEINRNQIDYDVNFLQQVVDEVLNANPETVSQLAKSNLTVNKKNLNTLDKMKNDKTYANKTLQELIDEEDVDISELSSEFNEEFKNTANDKLVEILKDSNIDIKSLQLYGEAINILNMQNSLNSLAELAYKSYPIRLPISSDISNLRMYVLNENASSKEEVNIAFALNLSNGGEVNAVAKFNNKTQALDVNIVCENNDFAKLLENNKQELINIFEGFADNNVYVSIS